MNRKKILTALLIVLFAVIVLIIGLYIYKNVFTLYSTKTSPEPSKIPTISPYVDVYFNKDIKSVGLATISSDKGDILDKYIIKDNLVRLYITRDHYALDSDIYIRDILSTDDISLDTLVIPIKFTVYEEDDLPEDLLKYILADQDKDTDKNADPILSVVPHSSLDFDIMPDLTRFREDGSVIVDLNITLLLSNADSGEYRQTAIDSKKNLALSYLRDKGFNPEDYKITFIIPE